MTDETRRMKDVGFSKLRIVATPIGNMADLSARAADALRTSTLILCEDTRHSRPLLDRIGAKARLLPCHAHNETDCTAAVLAEFAHGGAVALVTDAGAPAVSDPGGRVVEACVAHGVDVEVFPGPSALVAALMGAGIDLTRFAFLGFLPRKGKAREELVQGALRAGFGVVVYEAANRVHETLKDLFLWCGARRVVVARELTKVHETFHRGVLGSALQPPFVEKGEAVILVEAGAAVIAEVYVDDETLPHKERARRMAKAKGISVREAYGRVKDIQNEP